MRGGEGAQGHPDSPLLRAAAQDNLELTAKSANATLAELGVAHQINWIGILPPAGVPTITGSVPSRSERRELFMRLTLGCQCPIF